MPEFSRVKRRLSIAARVWSEAIAYALYLTLIVTLGASLVGIGLTGSIVTVKTVLFIAGWAIMSYATIKLWSSSKNEIKQRGDGYTESVPETLDRSRVHTLFLQLPPFRWIRPPPPERRLSKDSKLFISGIAVLLLSFVMERFLGIA